MSPAALVDTALALALGGGSIAVLSTLPWFRRRSTLARLAPYLPGGTGGRRNPGHELGLQETLEPILNALGSRLSSLLGVITDLETRLLRAGRTPDPYRFRLRQSLGALGAFASASLSWVTGLLPDTLALFGIVAAPLIALLWAEHDLARAIEQRQRQLAAELPVVIEQLGLLICAGYSLTSAVSHIAARGSGVVATDLAKVTADIRRGVGPTEAFESWATTSGSPAVTRLVAVLALNSETADLGGLITAEARVIRSEAHRDLLEVIERRAQLVWIPVTVATLVPGLIFLAVPFYSAMARITGG